MKRSISFNPDSYKISGTNFGTFKNNPVELHDTLFKSPTDSLIFNADFYKYIDMDFDESYEILAISDIHADYNRFLDFLLKTKLCIYKEEKKKGGYEDGKNYSKNTFESYDEEEKFDEVIDLEKEDIIMPNIQWNPKASKVVLVICGDLIDGRRTGRESDHTVPNNELNLHVLIYNLRLEAMKYNSFIFCTLGNHDFYAFHDFGLHGYLYNGYIDNHSRKHYINLMNKELKPEIEKYIIKIKSKIEKRIKELEKTNKELKQLNEELRKLEEIPNVFNNLSIEKQTYLSRCYILSRFYLIGYPFFLKINDSLFAHAGFYKKKNIFELFEDKKKNTNTQLNPQLIHRFILKEMSNIDNYINFLASENVTDTSYFYQICILNCSDQIHKMLPKITSKETMEMASYILNRESNNSLVQKTFFTREYQKDCNGVDDVLKIYNCNLMVVGHCPTCIGSEYFKDENVYDIYQDCNLAHIVPSCNGKLITVDIAFSSAFSPEKKFLEYLKITKKNKSSNLCSDFEKKIEVIRFNLDNFTRKVYKCKEHRWNNA